VAAGGDAQGGTASKSDEGVSGRRVAAAPFQHVTVLVRDSANIAGLPPLQDGEGDTHAATCHEVMQNIMREGGGGGGAAGGAAAEGEGIEDIRGTREQIMRCFQCVTMFELPFPAMEVMSGRGFSGKVAGCGDTFVSYMRSFVERTVQKNLKPKVLAGHVVSAHGIRLYLQTYISLFKDVNSFPSP